MKVIETNIFGRITKPNLEKRAQLAAGLFALQRFLFGALMTNKIDSAAIKSALDYLQAQIIAYNLDAARTYRACALAVQSVTKEIAENPNLFERRQLAKSLVRAGLVMVTQDLDVDWPARVSKARTVIEDLLNQLSSIKPYLDLVAQNELSPQKTAEIFDPFVKILICGLPVSAMTQEEFIRASFEAGINPVQSAGVIYELASKGAPDEITQLELSDLDRNEEKSLASLIQYHLAKRAAAAKKEVLLAAELMITPAVEPAQILVSAPLNLDRIKLRIPDRAIEILTDEDTKTVSDARRTINELLQAMVIFASHRDGDISAFDLSDQLNQVSNHGGLAKLVSDIELKIGQNDMTSAGITNEIENFKVHLEQKTAAALKLFQILAAQLFGLPADSLSTDDGRIALAEKLGSEICDQPLSVVKLAQVIDVYDRSNAHLNKPEAA